MSLEIRIEVEAERVDWNVPFHGCAVVVCAGASQLLRGVQLTIQLPDFRDREGSEATHKRLALEGSFSLKSGEVRRLPFEFTLADRFLFRCEAVLIAEVLDLREQVFTTVRRVPIDVAWLVQEAAEYLSKQGGLDVISCDTSEDGGIWVELQRSSPRGSRPSRPSLIPEDPLQMIWFELWPHEDGMRGRAEVNPGLLTQWFGWRRKGTELTLLKGDSERNHQLLQALVDSAYRQT